MGMNFHGTLRTNIANQIKASLATAGANFYVKIVANAVPATVNTSDAGNAVLANMVLVVSTNLADAANQAIAKNGTWSCTANNTGTAGHWRIYANDNTTCYLQGNCTNTGNGGDMTLDNVSIAVNQTVTVTGFTITAGNA